MTTYSLDEFTDDVSWDGKYQIVKCTRALSPSGLPEMDFALNPYTGCEHGCIYCYAPEVTHNDWDTWRVVRVKSNIAERLSKELRFAHGTIGIGTVTDPYQMAEKRFELTLRCLKILQRENRAIHMHTKSDLIIRDSEILASMDSIVGITITGTDERMSKIAEPGAPMPSKRLNALKELTAAGVRTYALVGPTLSHLEGHEAELIDAISSTGTSMIYVDKLNLRNVLAERLIRRHICGCSDGCLAKIRQYSEEVGLEYRDVFSV